MTPPARLRTVVLDCPNPLALAEFYRSLIGGELGYEGDEPDWVVFEPAVLALGARRHDVQPGESDGDTFRVYLDPVGHPFCLCWG